MNGGHGPSLSSAVVQLEKHLTCNGAVEMQHDMHICALHDSLNQFAYSCSAGAAAKGVPTIPQSVNHDHVDHAQLAGWLA